MGWLKRRDSGQAFMVRPAHGKSVSQALAKSKDEHLTLAELKRVAESRHIDFEKDVVPEEEIQKSQKEGKRVEGRPISLHPSDPTKDNIVVRANSPHLYDESMLNKDLDLREEQNRKVAEAKGLKIQEDIDEMRSKESKKREKRDTDDEDEE